MLGKKIKNKLSSTKKVLTLRDLAEAYNALKDVNIVNHPEFNYILSKNLITLEKEYRPIEDAMRPSKEFEEFTERLQELRNVYRKHPERLEEAIMNLRNEFRKALDERKEQIAKVEKMLKEKEVEIRVYTIEEDKIPENVGTHVIKAMMVIGMLQ